MWKGTVIRLAPGCVTRGEGTVAGGVSLEASAPAVGPTLRGGEVPGMPVLVPWQPGRAGRDPGRNREGHGGRAGVSTPAGLGRPELRSVLPART